MVSPGQGLPLWLPKGAELRGRLEDFLKAAQRKAGYEQVISPHIGNKELYITSGHYEKYGEDSFQPIETPADGESFLLKPMNCPHHCEIYKALYISQWCGQFIGLSRKLSPSAGVSIG